MEAVRPSEQLAVHDIRAEVAAVLVKVTVKDALPAPDFTYTCDAVAPLPVIENGPAGVGPEAAPDANDELAVFCDPFSDV